MQSHYTKAPRRRLTGMTLPEVVVAAALSVGVIGAATWFILEGTRTSYAALAEVENSIQQWSLSTKLQIDGKVANGVSIFLSATKSDADYLAKVPIDDGIKANGLERGNILVLSKSKLNQGVDTGIITDLIIYIYTPGSAPNYGTLKRFPSSAPKTYAITAPLDIDNKAKTVATLVNEHIDTILADATVVQDHVISVAAGKGPFGSFGDGKHVSIALVREETKGSIKRSNLTEVSFNLR